MEITKVKSISAPLKKFSYIAKDTDYITVTRWENGEGYNISINDRMFSLHETELDAINYLTKTLDYE